MSKVAAAILALGSLALDSLLAEHLARTWALTVRAASLALLPDLKMMVEAAPWDFPEDWNHFCYT